MEVCDAMALLLGCKSTSFRLEYFGLPLGGNPRSKTFLGPGNNEMLEKTGNVELKKAALNNFPIYFLSLSKAPKCVVKEIELLQGNFLRKGRETSKRGKCPCTISIGESTLTLNKMTLFWCRLQG